MEKWWTVKFLEYRLGRQQEYNNLMVSFKLLPDLSEVNIPKGHKFVTDQIEVHVKDIMVHMPSRSIWYQGTAHFVPDATRIVLSSKKMTIKNETITKYYRVGLLDENGAGIVLHYYPSGKINVVNTLSNVVEKPELLFEED